MKHISDSPNASFDRSCIPATIDASACSALVDANCICDATIQINSEASRLEQGNHIVKHKRIRPFNTKDTYPEQNLDNDLCQAVVARGATVFLRGQCPQSLDDGENIDSHDPVEQTHKVMQNIRQLIEEAGGQMEHLVKVVVYITDIRHREPVYRTMGEYIKGVFPVSTGLVVQALARPDWLVEIDATAVIPDS
jgi:enamine deaminase RidA (YjgF/YER057c/UK114 family)